MQLLTTNVSITTVDTRSRSISGDISHIHPRLLERAAKLNENLVVVADCSSNVETQAGDVSGHSNKHISITMVKFPRKRIIYKGIRLP